jgi:predicted enzyme related to lactoylglutathione lyase
MGNPVVHFEVTGKDGAALQRYYAELFGWKVTLHEPSGYRMVDTDSGGQGVGGGIMTSPTGDPMITFYVAVDDLQAALDRAEQLGGKTVLPPMDVPEGPSVAIFSDPEGNMMGLVSGME